MDITRHQIVTEVVLFYLLILVTILIPIGMENLVQTLMHISVNSKTMMVMDTEITLKELIQILVQQLLETAQQTYWDV